MAEITHDSDARRFETTLDGQLAGLDYEIEDGRMIITHTRVPDAIAGRGVAGRLVQAAFDHARTAGLRVRPVCSYAAAWATRHADVRPLLD